MGRQLQIMVRKPHMLLSMALALILAAGSPSHRTAHAAPNGKATQKGKAPQKLPFKFDPKVFGHMEDYFKTNSAGLFRAKSAFKKSSMPVMNNVQTRVCLLSAKVCPPFPMCGAFVTCETGQIVVCQSCAGAGVNGNGSPKNVCDFRLARCQGNKNTTAGISGSFCAPGKANPICGKEHSCSRDVKAKGTVYRCCRTQCPRGAFGSPVFFYLNDCGQKIMCPNGMLPNGGTTP